MCKRLLVLAFALLLAGAPNALGAVGIFDFTEDIGDVGGYGVTTHIAGAYEILASGSDIWGNADQFHYAYNEVSGNVRFELSPWWETAPDYWSKIEAMIRLNTTPGSVHYSQMVRREDRNTTVAPLVRPDDYTSLQWRETQDGGSGESGGPQPGLDPVRIGVQRVVSNGYQIVQGLTDYGSGWEAISTRLLPGLPDDILLGAAVTSHNNWALARAVITDVAYTENPDLVGIKTADPLGEPCGDIAGLLVKVAKMPDGWSFWDEDGQNGTERWECLKQAEHLVKNNGFLNYFGNGDYFPASESGQRVVEMVNLYDSGGETGGRWLYTGPTEESFPGIDAFIVDPTEPADGDDDSQFGVVVEGCIELTEGLHLFGGAFDDGVMLRIGGVEIGQTNAWNEIGQAWMFEAPVAGLYSLEAVGWEQGGGAGLELYYQLPNGNLVLLGDTAAGSPAVYCVPEPATIALLGFGGLSLLRIRRKR